jgi:hypothetical protein
MHTDKGAGGRIGERVPARSPGIDTVAARCIIDKKNPLCYTEIRWISKFGAWMDIWRGVRAV